MDVIIPALGESVTEATIGQWLKKAGDAVKADEPIVSLETDKVAVEVNAPGDGVLTELLFREGDTVSVGAVIARLGSGDATAAKPTVAPIATDVPAAAHAPDGEAGAPTGEGPVPTPEVVPAAANRAAAEPAAVPQAAPAAHPAPADSAQAPTTGPTARRKAEEGTPVAAPAANAAAPQGGYDTFPLARREERIRMTRLRQTI
ncbi:MAG: biotin/lipoyl-containing protein, partial [Sandaracinobacteroides sp.]